MMLLMVQPNGDILPNMDYITYVPEFRRVAKRSGRNVDSKTTIAELSYVFYVADWTRRNQFAALEDKERAVEAKKAAGLGSDWKPDNVINAAVDKYIEIQQKLYAKALMLVTLKRTMRQSSILLAERGEQMGIVREGIAAMMKQVQMTAKPAEMATLMGDIRNLQNILNGELRDVMKMVKEQSVAFKQLDELENEMMESLGKSLEVAGGGQPYNREIPGYSIF